MVFAIFWVLDTPSGLRYVSRFIYVILHILSRLEDTCNLSGPRYTSRSQINVALYILDIFEGIYNLSGSKYTLGSQVHLWFLGTHLGLRYTLRFIFWLYLKVLASFRVSNTLPNVKYAFGSQVHVTLHCLGILEGICNLLGPKYTFGS